MLEKQLCDSHLDEKRFEENAAVSKIKDDPNYFFRYAKKFSICKTDIGPLMNHDTNSLSNDKHEMCRLLVDQFTSVFTIPNPQHIITDPVSFFTHEPNTGINKHIFIYADDITLLAPSRASMVLMLEKCESFAVTHDILFNASKTKYMIFKRCESVNTAPLYFKNMPINCVHECDLLGITLSSSRTTANVIEKAVMKFNMKSNEIITDFKLLPCYIKSKLFTTFCTDAYGCQLWNFESREVHNFYVAWRKVVRKLWRLPYITHCNLLHTINNSLPIQISLEKRGVKSIWSCLNSDNCVVKTISQLATKLPRSVFGHNYRYFSYKYSIMSHQWYESYNSVHHSIMDYISRNCTDRNYGIMIRDLCHYRDSCDPHVLTATEIVQLIEYLCTI